MCPSLASDPRLDVFHRSISKLNVEVAFTFTSKLIKSITNSLELGMDHLTLKKGVSIQVVETMHDLAHARSAQGACFIRTDHTLVVWCDKVEDFKTTVETVESSLVELVWKRAHGSDMEILGDAEVQWSSADGIERNSDPREALLLGPAYTGLAFSLDVVFMGLFVRSLLKECLYDGDFSR
ncbi:hypothetical protein RQP46_011301 [Phenoliferia psychrophenolica]